jgi:hypothetical protein
VKDAGLTLRSDCAVGVLVRMTTLRALGTVETALGCDCGPDTPSPDLLALPPPSKSIPSTSTPLPPPVPSKSALAQAAPTDSGPITKAPQAIVQPIALLIIG